MAEEDKIFMNSWNLKQVIMLEGTLDITNTLAKIIEDIKSEDLIQKVRTWNYEYKE